MNIKKLLPTKVIQIYHHLRYRYPIYIFHHLPKCGGTSMVMSLHQWFVVSPDYFDERLGAATEPLDLTRFNRGRCLIGHFGHKGYQLDDRYPAIFSSFFARYRFRVFSFMREPLAMRCSLYRHQLRKQPELQLSLFDSIMQNNNYYSRIMRVTEEDYLQKMDRYYYFGIYEELQNSFDVFAKKIGKPMLILPNENTTAVTKESTETILTEDQIKSFKQANELDYAIYYYALNRYNRDKRRYL